MTLAALVGELYPQQAPQILEYLRPYLENPAPPLPSQTDPDWYQSIQLYVTYPESFYESLQADFVTLANNLPYIRQLGCNAIHVLPFFNSPLLDRGFDISDFTRVRENLGGNQALNTFLEKAQAEKMNVFIDLVLNHTSDQHPWFQAAQEGDPHFQQFYIGLDEKPRLVKTWEDEVGLWAQYDLGQQIIDTRIIFPDPSLELPHWRQGTDGRWYYHTFYPNQLDLNWNNPDVFLAFCDIIMFWARQGVNFRLDAVPFIGKQVELGIIESTNRTHLLVQAFHKMLEQAAPHTAFLVEACQPIEVTKQYFGQQEVEAEFAYNFRLMQSLWASLVSSNTNYIWQALQATQAKPHWAQWITFIRNHDELTLEFAETQERLLIYEGLQGNGLPFRAGFGLAGRTASFFQHEPRKATLAYFLLASLPGVPAIVYGDELGKGNDLEYMQSQTELRQLVTGNPQNPSDARDANRGTISHLERNKPSALQLYTTFSDMFTTRQRFRALATQIPQRLEGIPDDIFAAEYDLGGSTLQVFLNLSDDPFQHRIKPLATRELSINYAFLKDDRIILPPYSGIWIRFSTVKSC